MERLSILMSQQSRNPHQNSKGIPHRTKIMKIKSPKIHMGAQKAPDSKQTIEQKEQRKMHHNIWFQIIPESRSHRNSMVLAQKQTCKPRSRIKDPEPIPLTYTYQILNKGTNKQTNKYTEEKTTSSINSAGKTRHPCVRGMKLVSSVSGDTKVISKWIKDFVLRQETDNARGKVRQKASGYGHVAQMSHNLKK